MNFRAGTLPTGNRKQHGILTEEELCQLSDERLMQLLKEGHDEAMTLLFRRRSGLLLSIALRILHDQGEAEELVQDVFFEIYRKIDQFDPGKGSARIWMMQFAYARSINRRRDLTLRKFYDRHPLPAASPDGWEPRRANVHDELTAEERTQTIRRAMEHLPEKQRQAVELICFQGLLMKEVAAQMSESVVNARNHYYRGIRKLQSLVNEPAPQRIAILGADGDDQSKAAKCV